MHTTVPLHKQKSKRVTLADVAAKAGVSVATASVAVTGRPSGNCRVSPSVAEKVRAVAKELQYRPNLQARNLSTQRTRTIALLIKRSMWHNASYYISACQRVVREFDFTEMVLLHPDDELKSERAHLEMCVERQVEGIVAMPLIDLNGNTNVEAFNRVYEEEKIPIVQIGLALDGCVAPSVTPDESGGVKRAVTLLHAMGHRHIAHCTNLGYDNAKPMNPFRAAYLRYRGYSEGIAELGLTEQVFVPPQQCTDVNMLYDSAAALAPVIAKASPRPTAIIAFSDYVGAGLIAGLTDAKVGVPDDISILSFGEQPFTRMLRPPLSTLSPLFEKIAEVATHTLLKMIEGKPGVSQSLLPALSMRASVREIVVPTP